MKLRLKKAPMYKICTPTKSAANCVHIRLTEGDLKGLRLVLRDFDFVKDTLNFTYDLKRVPEELKSRIHTESKVKRQVEQTVKSIVYNMLIQGLETPADEIVKRVSEIQ